MPPTRPIRPMAWSRLPRISAAPGHSTRCASLLPPMATRPRSPRRGSAHIEMLSSTIGNVGSEALELRILARIGWQGIGIGYRREVRHDGGPGTHVFGCGHSNHSALHVLRSGSSDTARPLTHSAKKRMTAPNTNGVTSSSSLVLQPQLRQQHVRAAHGRDLRELRVRPACNCRAPSASRGKSTPSYGLNEACTPTGRTMARAGEKPVHSAAEIRDRKLYPNEI